MDGLWRQLGTAQAFQIIRGGAAGKFFERGGEAVPVVKTAFESQPVHIQLVDGATFHELLAMPYSKPVEIIIEITTQLPVEKCGKLVGRDVYAVGKVMNAIPGMQERFIGDHERI